MAFSRNYTDSLLDRKRYVIIDTLYILEIKVWDKKYERKSCEKR